MANLDFLKGTKLRIEYSKIISALKKFLLFIFLISYFIFSSCAQWGNLISNTSRDLYGLYFLNEQTGFAIGDSGTILKTIDKGKTWTSINSGANAGLNEITFVSSTKGFIVGNSGTFLKSTDGGSSWSFQSGITNLTLNGICFINNSNTGFMVGDVGLILKTTDGGSNWNTKNSGVVYSLSSVAFANDTLGFAVGSGGTLLKTIDKGENWTPVNLGMTEVLSDIIFTGNNSGYIAGNIGKIFKTTDNGMNWQGQTSNTTEWLTGIDCLGDMDCVANGSNGASVKTSDGNIWKIQSSPVSDFLQDVKMPKQYTAYSCGFGGTILKTCPEIIFSATMITKGTIQFNDSSKNYSQIKWFFGDGDSSMLASPLHTFPDTFSTYIVKIFATNESDCVDSAIVDFVPNGYEEFKVENLKFKISPNPFSEKIWLRITNRNEFTNERLELRIYDVLEREVYQSEIRNSQSEIYPNLPSGVYFYQIISNRKSIARGKLVKQ